MSSRLFEIYLGAFVLFISGIFLWSALEIHSRRSQEHFYPLFIRYTNVGNLSNGVAVRIAGVRVGSVQNIRIDPETFEAHVGVLIDPVIALPEDTTAQITIGGLFGDAEVRLIPGKSRARLKPEEEITSVIDAIYIEDAVGSVIYNLGK